MTIMELRVGSEFESKIHPLTEDKYRLLEENILYEGAALMPLIVWNGTIVDGHNRYKILRENTDIPFTVHEKNFDNRYEALSWICKNQLGRRNLTPIQKRVLVGERYNAEKMSNGAHDGFRGNQYTNLVVGQNSPVPSTRVTRHKIADESGVTEAFVKYAGQYSDGISAAEEVAPGFRQEVLSGKIKPTQQEMRTLA